MSSPPAAEASGAAGASSYFHCPRFRQCRGKDCRPLGPAPSPEPMFHSHWWDSATFEVSRGFWGTELSAAARNAAEDITALRTSSSRRQGNTSGERTDELGEAGEMKKAGGTVAAAAAAVEAATAEPLMLLNCPPALPALPALPARGADFSAPVVPVFKLLQGARETKGLGGGSAMTTFRQYVEFFATRSPVCKGEAPQRGVFATQPFEGQEVVMAFKRQYTEGVSKRLAARRRLNLNGYVVHDGGDPIYPDVSTFGFPARVVNNCAKPNVYVCTVTAGYCSVDKFVFVFSLRAIAAGDELFHDPVERVTSL